MSELGHDLRMQNTYNRRGARRNVVCSDCGVTFGHAGGKDTKDAGYHAISSDSVRETRWAMYQRPLARDKESSRAEMPLLLLKRG
jgi:hypothetical protein